MTSRATKMTAIVPSAIRSYGRSGPRQVRSGFRLVCAAIVASYRSSGSGTG